MNLPSAVQQVLGQLSDAGFEAYAVGGCVRDLLLNRTPTDWDVTTNATPEEIQGVFSRSFYTNQFGTVTVQLEETNDTLREIEVTTYRTESDYNDQRHPDTVGFTSSLREDLARRDFTVNALAFRPAKQDSQPGPDAVLMDNYELVDPFGGLQDLQNNVLRAVGEPKERFSEDALRLLRAVRLAAQLNFTIEPDTLTAVTEYAPAITAVSQERIRDELVKLVMSTQPESGFVLLEKTGLLAHILPEVAEGVGITQNKHHIYTVFEHCIKSLQWAAQYEYPLHVRLAALFHDIGKPRTRRQKGNDYTFYAHDIVGARMTEKLMRRLHFPNTTVARVTHLVRHHMFYYDVGKVTEAGARRLLRRVGREYFDDLIKVRIAERKGSGVPKAEPYRLRHLQFLVEKAAQAPVTVGQLVIGGNDLIKELKLKPGPQIGGILNALLAEALDDPSKNTREHLLARAAELVDVDPATLKSLGAQAVDDAEKRREDIIRKKYHV